MVILTVAHVPSEMTYAVERVERKRRGEDGLAHDLDGNWETSDEGDDVGGGECRGGGEVGEGVAVEDCECGGCVRQYDGHWVTPSGTTMNA
jgi:hypothetical protein